MPYTYEKDGLSEEQCQLANEFETLCTDVQKQIKAKIEVARQALREAQELAEQHGVPFRSGISPLSNSFVPASFGKSKFRNLDREMIGEIAGVWGEFIDELYDGCGGWLHSAVC